MTVETQNAKVRRLVKSGEYKKALQICKEWNYENPMHREILRLGYESMMYPSFYRQIGKDPAKNYEAAVEVLLEVYGR